MSAPGGVPAWALWLLVVQALVAVPLLDRLLRQAGRPAAQMTGTF